MFIQGKSYIDSIAINPPLKKKGVPCRIGMDRRRSHKKGQYLLGKLPP
jgi:hypothetical protein